MASRRGEAVEVRGSSAGQAVPAGAQTANLQRMAKVLGRLPRSLLVLYFVNAFLPSFPMVAMADWLNAYLEMPLAAQSQFYAFTFIPWCLKPAYATAANWVASWEGDGWIAAYGRRRSRALLLHVCGLCSGGLYAATYGVETSAGAFGVFFCINIFTACAELMLGSYLMQAAHVHMDDAGAVQGLAGAARMTGSVAAALVSLGMYPCDNNQAPNSRVVIACTGCFALLNFVVAWWLPDIPGESLLGGLEPSPPATEREGGEPGHGEHAPGGEGIGNPLLPKEAPPSSSSLKLGGVLTDKREEEEEHRRRPMDILDTPETPALARAETEKNPPPIVPLHLVLYMAGCILALLLVLVWISLKDMVVDHRSTTSSGGAGVNESSSADDLYNDDGGAARTDDEENLIPESTWWSIFGVLTAVAIGSFVFLGWSTKSQGSSTAMLNLAIPGAFLFLYNATPSASDQLYSFKYFLFWQHPCRLTQLNLISATAGVAGYLLYGWLCNGRRIRRVFVATIFVGVLASLLWLPLFKIDDADDPTTACVRVGAGSGCIEGFAFACVVETITGLTSMLTVAPSTVLATESSPAQQKTLAYAVYLSLIDSGGSASGWITSPIVDRLSIDYGDWDNMPKLIYIAALSQFACIALLPFLRDWQRQHRDKPATPGGGDDASSEDDAHAHEPSGDEQNQRPAED
uniref:Uncharacterized protein n=1 Tax=Rhizochromulina marina TaxID=1034831 RepID=A0A7S2S1G1_9STRA|mmetsp:Transcript_23329/g.68108  ORF Transcript_23329/g.68108 Transcript_23329/m.68108 type:complete len:688 (+) Transcript_23329:127-2190(+)